MSSRNNKTRNVKVTSRPDGDVQVKRSKLPPLSAADFAVGPQNKYVRPQSAFQSAASTNQILKEEESETTVRPNTAPTGKVLRGLSPETPPHRRTSAPKKELKKSHLTPVPKDGNILSSLYYDFPGENEGHTKKRNSHTVFAGNQFTDSNTTKNRDNEDAQLSPVFDGPKEAWPIAGVTTVIVSPPEDTAPSKPFYKQPSYEQWLAGPELDSDEYDTDLEEDFPKAPEKPIDPTGKYVYEEECLKLGLVPVSYISRHLADRHLGMRHHYLGGERTLPIAEALKNNTVTEALDLTDNYIEGCGAYCIADMINTNLFIVSLNLSNNFLKTEGAKAIAEMLESNTTLKSLSLSGNQLTDLDCRMFVEPLKNNMSLTSLDLSHNEIGDIGVSWIASALVVNEGIVELDLSWNAVQQKGASALGNTLLKNQHLEVLDLSWNGVGMHGVAGIAKGLRGNHKLRVLDLSNNRLETKAMANLCPAVRKNTGLETLILNLNPMKEAGLELLLKAVSDHPTLKFLSVEEVVITRPIYEKIEDLREKRDLIVVHGEVGGYQRFTARGSVVRLFKRFLCENRHHLEATLRLQDKDREGVVTMEELKIAFRESGIRLTNKQLELLLAHGNLSTGGYIHYSGLLDGSSLR